MNTYKFFLLLTLFYNFNIYAQLNYIFEPVLEEDCVYLKVELTFLTEDTDRTVLQLPDSWQYETELYDQISNLEILTPNVEIESFDGAARRTLRHEPGQSITISYQIMQQQYYFFRFYRAFIVDDLFHFMGRSTLIYPKYEQTTDIEMNFTWKDLPPDWLAVTSFGDSLEQTVIASLFELDHCLFVAGDIRIWKFKINDKPITLVINQEFEVKDVDLIDCLKKVIVAQRNFFNDQEFPNFLVSMIAVSDEINPMGGQILTNGFAIYVSPDETLDEIAFLFGHENFHCWIGHKSNLLYKKDLFWFSEGFTEYYGLVFALQTNFIDFPKFIEWCNNSFANYYLSTKQNVTNDQLAEEFYSDNDVCKIPYWRGLIFALLLNYKIKKNSNQRYSLDNVLMDIWNQARETNSILSMHTLIEIFKRYVPDIEEDVERYINQGQLFSLPSDLFGSEWRFCETTDVKFDHCFDCELSLKENCIRGVRVNSNAYQAGLRDGQRLGNCKIYHDPKREAIIILHDGTIISYLPQANELIKLPKYLPKRLQ